MLTDQQKQLVKEGLGQGDFLQEESKYLTQDGNLYELDFDNTSPKPIGEPSKKGGNLLQKLGTIKKKNKTKKEENMHKKREEDMKGSDIPEDEDEEAVKEEDEEEPSVVSSKKKSTDLVEICPKKLKDLEEKAKKLDMIEKEKADLLKKQEDLTKEKDAMTKDFSEWKSKVEVIFKEREAEQEAKRQEKIKQLNNDFYIPIEEIKNDSMADLLKTEKRLGFAVKKKEDPTELTLETDMIQLQNEAQDLVAKYVGGAIKK